MSQTHNDSTSITFTGQYLDTDDKLEQGRPIHRSTQGHKEEFPGDFQQWPFILTTAADRAVPILPDVDHRNATDDTIRIRTWEALRKL